MITLRPLDAKVSNDVINQLNKLSISEAQLPYVGTIEQVKQCITDSVSMNLILAEEQVVGVFLLDEGYYQDYKFASDTDVGFRAFFIDQHHQGRGYAKQALLQLPEYVKARCPRADSLVLTVNCKNEIAYSLYLRCGFLEAKEKYHGGPFGPQHIMRLALP